MESLTYLDHLIGTRDYAFYAAKWTFAFIGISISLWNHSKKRDPESKSTPPNFSLSFLIRDNIKRVWVTVALVFIFLRFPGMLLSLIPIDLKGEDEIQLGLSLLIGLGLDKLSEKLKEVNWLGLKNTKVREEILNNKNQDL